MDLAPDDWLAALGAGELNLDREGLAERLAELSADQALALLAWWSEQLLTGGMASGLGQFADLVGRPQGAAAAALLRQALGPAQGGSPDPALGAVLLPLLGYQRDPQDFPRLRALALNPGPMALRRGALEGLARGLSCWPLGPLRQLLVELTADLDPQLAALAMDLLARLPWAREGLSAVAARGVDPLLAPRLARRRAAAPPSDLLLLIHGRSGGVVPQELWQLAEELRQQRGCRVILQPLTDPAAAEQALVLEPAPLTLVPLFQLPGHHVRHDLPEIAAQWRLRGWPLRRLPFLGAWPRWQQGLAEALGEAQAQGWRPELLHHPLGGTLAARYPQALAQRLGVPIRPWDVAAYSDGPALLVPLAVAANRLSETLQRWDRPPGVQVWPPLLQQLRFRRLLLEQLLLLA